MAEHKGLWEQFRDEILNTPEKRERHENGVQELLLVSKVMTQIDECRQEAGLSKAALARGIGADPATIRRLLTAPSSNPNLRTVFRLLDALGLELTLQQVRAPRTALFTDRPGAQRVKRATAHRPKRTTEELQQSA